MATADITHTLVRALSASGNPTMADAPSTTLRQAHREMIARLLGNAPHDIRFVADSVDLAERATHVEDTLTIVFGYLGRVIADTAENAPAGSIDRKYLIGLMDDLKGDIFGPLANASEELAAQGRD